MGSVLLQRSDGGGTPSMVVTERVVVSILAAMTLSICSIRLYVRKFVTNSFGNDDYFVLLAMFWVLGFCALSLTISFYGIGRRQVDVSYKDLVIWLKIYYVAIATYLIVASAVKTSLVLFLMRTFPQKYIQRTGRGLIVFLAVFSISGSLAVVFQCKPISAAWNKKQSNYTCFSANTMFGITMYQGVLMFVTDVVIIVLPMPVVWKRQMPLKKRLMVIGIFSIGFVACIALLVRFSTLVYTKNQTDYTYAAAASLIWMNVEYNLGLVSGSLPSLRVFFKIGSISSTNEDSHLRSGPPGLCKAYELRSCSNKFEVSGSKLNTWTGEGILKRSEVTIEGEYRGKPLNDSQERIVVVV